MTNQEHEPEIIFIYSRREAICDGVQKEITDAAREAGIRYPVFVTRSVYAEYVNVPSGVEGQDEDGRLWDIVWMLACAIRSSAAGSDAISFQLYVRNSNEGEPELVTISAVCGPLDFDDPQPAITIMLPGED
jgi:hypothetical protein